MKLLLFLIFLAALGLAHTKSLVYEAKSKPVSDLEAAENKKKHDAWVIVGAILIIPTIIALIVHLSDILDLFD